MFLVGFLIWVAVSLMVAIGAWAVFVAPRRYRLARRAIAAPGLPPAANGITILHLSDLHFRLRDPQKLRFIQSLAQHPVDFIFITGDLTEDDDGHETCAEALRNLKGRFGAYAVLGSHDYYRHTLWDVVRHQLVPGDRKASARNTPERLVERLREIGVCLLSNEGVRVEVRGVPIRIIGLDDPYLKRHDLRAALQGAQPEEFKVMLVHAPEVVEESAAAGINLVFAGHTHGGQVRLPGIGALVTHCTLPPRYASGVFTHGGTTFHLNNGIGVGRYTGIRFFCPPEATIVTLEARTSGRP